MIFLGCNRTVQTVQTITNQGAPHEKVTIALAATAALSSTPAMATDFDVTLTNLTNGIYFTPLLVTAHNDTTHLYMEGMAASAHLQMMAEGGDMDAMAGSSDLDSRIHRWLNPVAKVVIQRQR